MIGRNRSDRGSSPDAALDRVLDYHERTKHRHHRYARSAGFMDWSRQPDPFRLYVGARRVDLEPIPPTDDPRFDALFREGAVAPRVCDRAAVSQLLYDSLALSAWKELGSSRWSLRVNPSSGNLHPTEGYLFCGPVAGIGDQPAVFHYTPLHHALESRATIPPEAWRALLGGLHPHPLAVGLTTIHWRESWKYGERAFRYCHLDLGHALGALAIAAAILGWRARLDARWSDRELAELFGVATQSGPEAEHPDCLVAVAPGMEAAWTDLGTRGAGSAEIVARMREVDWSGRPNRLSPSHHAWPVIDDVARATTLQSQPAWRPHEGPGSAAPFGEDRIRLASAREIVRGRRSAVAMDSSSWIDRESFFRILARCMPGGSGPPFELLPWKPTIHLVLFLHRVDGMKPGLYLLARRPDSLATLRDSMRGGFDWMRPDGCPKALPFWRLRSGDLRDQAADVSCQQAIASDGAFAAAMIAEFEPVLDAYGPWFYRRLHWEAGAIGQMLYLEAEAAGLRGTGIGCFFDDEVHDLLGLDGRRFQDLYHFTVGGPVEDPRLRTHPAYGPGRT
jgi:SagB-type dehydrogenase family enzyme